MTPWFWMAMSCVAVLVTVGWYCDRRPHVRAARIAWWLVLIPAALTTGMAAWEAFR